MEKPPGRAAAAVCGNLSYVSRLPFNYFETPEFGISQTLATVCCASLYAVFYNLLKYNSEFRKDLIFHVVLHKGLRTFFYKTSSFSFASTYLATQKIKSMLYK